MQIIFPRGNMRSWSAFLFLSLVSWLLPAWALLGSRFRPWPTRLVANWLTSCPSSLINLLLLKAAPGWCSSLDRFTSVSVVPALCGSCFLWMCFPGFLTCVCCLCTDLPGPLPVFLRTLSRNCEWESTTASCELRMSESLIVWRGVLDVFPFAWTSLEPL